jgi:predicted nucleotidyltransferase
MSEIFTFREIESKSQSVFYKNNVVRAYLFGSYANGLPDGNSDIDIAIDTGGRISFLRVCGVMEELSQVFNKRVDLFDFREIEEGSGILDEIKKRGILIYEKEQ